MVPHLGGGAPRLVAPASRRHHQHRSPRKKRPKQSSGAPSVVVFQASPLLSVSRQASPTRISVCAIFDVDSKLIRHPAERPAKFLRRVRPPAHRHATQPGGKYPTSSASREVRWHIQQPRNSRCGSAEHSSTIRGNSSPLTTHPISAAT